MELYFDEGTGTWDKLPDYSIEIRFDTEEELEKYKTKLQNMNRYRWHDLRKDSTDLPPNEEVVEIAFVNSYTGKYYTARAFYEDGTMHSEDSLFGGEDLFEWCEYDEDTDDYIIPVGWFEHVMFGEYYTEINGKFVIAWREIEPYEPED